MYNQKQISSLKKYLKYGDMKRIADSSGFHYVTVVNMLNGKYKIHPLVLEAASKIVSARRKKMEESIKD